MHNKEVAIFGVSSYSRQLLETLPEGEKVVAYVDNDFKKQGSCKDGVPILSPDKLLKSIDRVYIAAGATQNVYNQMLALGISESKIVKPRLLLSENIGKLDALKNRHQNGSVIIIGNGPSLRIKDLDLIHEKGMISFGFNKIYLAFEETPFRPTYYMVEDVLVAQNNALKINELNGLNRLYADYLLRYLDVDDDSILFGLGTGSSVLEDEFSMNPLSFRDGGSVSCTAIQMAFYMGVSKIFLIGMDFDFNEAPSDPESSNVLINDKEKNHFHPDYRKENEKWTKPRMSLTQAFYESASREAEKRGIEIINLTRGGKLDVFQRDSFDNYC